MISPFADLTEMAEAVRAGTTTSTQLVEQALARADRLDPLLGTFISRFDDQARQAAAAIDARHAQGSDIGPMGGVPIAIKDFIAAKEGPTTAQSLVHDPAWWKSADADVVRKLRDAGAIIIGKTTMVEHAAGRPDPKTHFPLPRNPWDIQRWTGGSSTGTANGIAAGIFPAGLGTDTAGSVRIPAAMCGITGLKPTHGLIPLEGCLPASKTLDVIGPMARSARDCATLLRVLSPRPVPHEDARDNLRGVRIGVPWELLRDPSRNVDPECLAAFDGALAELEQAGAEIRAFDLGEFDSIMAATMLIMVHEIFQLHQETLRSKWLSYGRSFRRLAATGSLITRADYVVALEARGKLTSSLLAKMSELDAVATPTWATAAPLYQGNGGMPGRETNFTAPWNATGFPALALPMGFDGNGLPLSMQLIGHPHSEHRLLGIGTYYQCKTDWHTRHPNTDDYPAAQPVPDLDDPRETTQLLEELADQLAPVLRAGLRPESADLPPIRDTFTALRAAALALASDNT